MLRPGYDRIYFEVPSAIKQRLETYCKQMRMSKTEVLQNAIEGLVLNEELPLQQLMQSEDPWATKSLSSSQIRPWLHSLAAEANEDLALADKLRMTIEHLIEVERALRER